MTRSSSAWPQDVPGTAAPSLTQLRAGDADALAECYHSHAGRLLMVAYRLTANWSDAEDVVHDVFVGLPEALLRCEERGQFGAWLTRVTLRVALMKQRDDARYAHDTVAIDNAPAATAPDDSIIPPRVHAALGALSPALRHVFVLRVLHDLTHAQIATLLGIAASTSEVRFHRAVQQLRRTLGDAS